MKREEGQSLTEFLMIVPIFFLLICFFIAIFQSKIRLDTDEHTSFVLGNSQAFFDGEERTLAQWSSLQIGDHAVLQRDAHAAFNPSEGFPYASDKQDSVYFDKKKVDVKANSKCQQNGSAVTTLLGNGGFTLESCSDATGYDTGQLEMAESALEKVQGVLALGGNSLYFSDFFAFEKRKKATAEAHATFRKSHASSAYFSNYAAITHDSQSNFIYECLMNPWEDRWVPARRGLGILAVQSKNDSAAFLGSSEFFSLANKSGGKFKDRFKEELKEQLGEGVQDLVDELLEMGMDERVEWVEEWKTALGEMRDRVEDRRTSGNCQPYFPAYTFAGAALEIGAWEHAFCVVEITAVCTAAGPGVGACVLAREAVAVAQMLAGFAPSACPIVNRLVDIGVHFTAGELDYKRSLHYAAELHRRSGLTPSF